MTRRLFIVGGLAALCFGTARLPRPAPRSYEVQLAMTGFSGLTDSEDCRSIVSVHGYDSLVGTVRAEEPAGPTDDDVVYSGRLRRITRLDNCDTKPNPTPDQLTWCVATLTGAATIRVELTVYGDPGQGAYLKADSAGKPDSVSVRGTCTQADMDELRNGYPGGESAGSPDGQPIADLNPPKFTESGIPRLRPGYFPPVAPQSAWGLRVVRAVP